MPEDATTPFSRLSESQKAVVNDIRKGLGFKKLDATGTIVQPRPEPESVEDEGAVRGRKKPRTATQAKTSAFSLLRSTGIWFLAAGSCIHSFDLAATHGATAKWSTAEAVELLVGSTRMEDLQAHRILVKLFDDWLEQARLLGAKYDFDIVLRFFFLHQEHVWNDLCKNIHDYALGRRQQDTHDVKFLYAILLPNPIEDSIIPALGNDQSKSGRGYKHALTRAYLVSCEQRQIFPVLRFKSIDPEVPMSAEAEAMMLGFASGAVRIGNDHYPSCFYLDYTKFDPAQPWLGLFRGFVLVRMLRWIWLNSDAVFKGLGKDKGIPSACIARTQRVDKVTPPMVAYAACQVRTMLQVSDWGKKDGSFSLKKMFLGIMHLFAETENAVQTAWQKETLDGLSEDVYNCQTMPEGDEYDEEDLAFDASVSIATAFAAFDYPPNLNTHCSLTRKRSLPLHYERIDTATNTERCVAILVGSAILIALSDYLHVRNRLHRIIHFARFLLLHAPAAPLSLDIAHSRSH
ncbi:hypothetical protein MKEN_00005000 [Mycena kentingensis (nom. inval.)]|nr:hypothetical protein MKEN_00005000 [Mycena kentingensis (nom. inval.)]